MALFTFCTDIHPLSRRRRMRSPTTAGMRRMKKRRKRPCRHDWMRRQRPRRQQRRRRWERRRQGSGRRWRRRRRAPITRKIPRITCQSGDTSSLDATSSSEEVMRRKHLSEDDEAGPC
jgi:hypothetical protein